MQRTQTNEQNTFSATTHAYALQLEANLRRRRAEMDNAWEDLDNGWQDLEQSMTEKGIIKAAPGNGDMVRLNVGGAHVNVRCSVLFDGAQESYGAERLRSLFDGVWDERVPRDADDRIVLDDSPTCVKSIVHALLKNPGKSITPTELSSPLPADERFYVPYISRVIGLTGSASQNGIVQGGSKVVDPADLDRVNATLLSWCPGKPSGLKLLYRGTRDGMTALAFHSRCTSDTAQTITLVRVAHPDGGGYSIVGGFSAVPWTLPLVGGFEASQESSKQAFLFMLVDEGIPLKAGSFTPSKWSVKTDSAESAVQVSPSQGPRFGDLDLSVKLDRDPCTIRAGSTHYCVQDGSSFLGLDRKTVTEVEVFSVSPEVTIPSPSTLTPASDDIACNTATVSKEEADDTRRFSAAIAASLTEEKISLRDAEAELSRAKVKANAAAHALSHIYGPEIASGTKDEVVELSVQGARVTTLRSTLQACPESALAARFDEGKWPVHEKEVDENGRRKIDCTPTAFAKLLDILRMRKRAGWASNEGQDGCGIQPVRVIVREEDFADFTEFVDMYFPGCESFIMDLTGQSPAASDTSG